jgi:hypothetical protein
VKKWKISLISMVWHGPLLMLISRTPLPLETLYDPFRRVQGWTFQLVYRNLGIEKKFFLIFKGIVRNFFGTCVKQLLKWQEIFFPQL